MNLQEYESAITDPIKSQSSKGFRFVGIQYTENLFEKNNPVVKNHKPEDIAEFFKRVVEVVSDNMSSVPLDLSRNTEDNIASNIWEDINFITSQMFPKDIKNIECFLTKEGAKQGYFTIYIGLSPPGDKYSNHSFTKLKACIAKEGHEFVSGGVLR